MERKHLIAVGVEGPAQMIVATGDPVWVPTDSTKGTLLFGLKERKENDAENALRFAANQVSSEHRFIVKDVQVDVDQTQAHLNWQNEFGKDSKHLERGDVLVSPNLARVYERLFLFEKVEEKGEELYFLRGIRRRPARIRGYRASHAPLVGRDLEVSRMEELLEQVQEDQGQILGLVGDAGIGKTRLAVSLKELAKEKSIPCFEGSYTTSGNEPYQGFRPLIRTLAGEDIQTLSRWEMSEAETDFLRLFLEPDKRIERLSNLSDEQIRQGLFYSVRKLLHSAGKAPLVLILEDLHWADSNSIELVNYILDSLDETHLLLVLIHRTDLSPPWKDQLNYNEIKVKPLEGVEIDRFSKVLLDIDQISSKALAQLSKLSQGNPLFIEEMIRHLVDEKALEIETDDEGRKSLQVRSDISSIPTTLHMLVSSRLDRMASDEIDILRWASLLGSQGDTKELESLLLSQSTKTASQSLKELFNKNWLMEKSVFPKQFYQFSHDLIFDVISQSIPEQEKTKRYGIIGKFLLNFYASEPDLHMERTANYLLDSKEKMLGLKTGIRAGEIALSHYKFPQAVSFFKKAEKIWKETDQKTLDASSIYEPFIRSLLAVGEIETAGKAFEDWKKAGLASSAEALGNFACLEMNYFRAKSEHMEVVKASERALQAFGNNLEFEQKRYDIIHDRIQALLYLGKADQALHEGLQTLRELNDGRYPLIRLRLWGRLAFCAVASGNSEIGLDYIEKAQALLPEDTPPQIHLELMVRAEAVYLPLARYVEADEACKKAIEIAQEAGLRQDLTRARLFQGMISYDSGEYIKGLSELEKAIKEARQNKDQPTERNALEWLIDTLLLIGAIKEAENKQEEVRRLQKDTAKDPWIAANEARLKARFAHIRGDLAQGSKYFREVHKYLEQGSDFEWAQMNILKALALESEGKLRPTADLVKEFQETVMQQHMNSLSLKWQTQITAMRLSANGAKHVPLLDPAFKPSECANVWLRQMAYVAKVRWLDSQGKTKEAKKLRTEYQKERERIAQKVPTKYKTDFFNHSFYKVPE